MCKGCGYTMSQMLPFPVLFSLGCMVDSLGMAAVASCVKHKPTWLNPTRLKVIQGVD